MESTRALGVEAPHQEEGRVVKDVGAKIPHGEFLVYYSTSPDNVRCDPDGNAPNGTNEAGRLFESFDHARAYAAKKANSARLIGAGVYDDRWRILVQFASEEALRRETKKRQPGVFFFGRPHSSLLGQCCSGGRSGQGGQPSSAF
jgi:hypothetical protein